MQGSLQPSQFRGSWCFTCNTFTDSLVESAKVHEGDINRVVKCDLCEDEDATMYCVEDHENLCPTCSKLHKKSKASTSHQQIPLEDALAGNATVKRIPRCQKHIGMEINLLQDLQRRCLFQLFEREALWSLLLPPSQEISGLQDQIAGYTISITEREEEARKAIDTLDGTITKIEDHRSTAEKDIAAFVSALHATVDARAAVLVAEMQTKGDQLRKTAIQERGEAELATLQFREFHSFTEGLLTQGNPFEIVGTHKMVNV